MIHISNLRRFAVALVVSPLILAATAQAQTTSTPRPLPPTNILLDGQPGVAVTPSSGVGAGWTLDATKVGLAPHGLSCDALPLYNGPSKPAAGTTITMQRITYSELDLSAGNITLDRVCVKPSSAGNRASVIFGYDPDTASGQQGDVIIKDSEINGSAATNSLIFATCAFRGAGSLYRNNIFGTGSGICYFGSSSVSTSVIEHNFVHGLRAGNYGNPPQPSHNSSATLRSFGGTSLVWRNNRLVSRSGADSGALFIQAFGGPIRNVVVEGNYLESAGWDMPLEPYGSNGYSGMTAVNNRFERGGYGAAYVGGGAGWAVWSDNHVFDASGVDGKGAVVPCPGGACAPSR